MLGNDALKERIRSIARIRRGSGEDTGTPDDLEAAPPAKRRRKQRAVTGATDSGDGIGVAPQPVAIAVTGVEEFLPGGEWQGVHGKVYVHERLRSTIEKPKRTPPAFSACTHSIAAITPSMPSYLPASRTVSRCEPSMRHGEPGCTPS